MNQDTLREIDMFDGRDILVLIMVVGLVFLAICAVVQVVLWAF